MRVTRIGHAPTLTSLTAFRLVFELLVVEEKLFPGGKHEFGAAIYAL
jgi:hypothetical protein